MPAAFEDEFAVNQQAEQIIFEVEPDGEHVSAPVLIRYAGVPKSFAWIVPVPGTPELALSHQDAFGIVDSATAPAVDVRNYQPCSLGVMGVENGLSNDQAQGAWHFPAGLRRN